MYYLPFYKERNFEKKSYKSTKICKTTTMQNLLLTILLNTVYFHV